MCITTSPAHLKNTVILSLKEKENRRTLVYMNDAKSKNVDKNMMLIAIPCTDDKTINLIDLTGQGDDIKKQVHSFKFENPERTWTSKGMTRSRSLSLNIEKIGMYTVYYSKNLNDLNGYCEIPASVKHFYSKYSQNELLYFGFVWEGTESISAQPICINYNAGDNWDLPYFPMLDKHDSDNDEKSLIRTWVNDSGTDYDHYLVYGEIEEQDIIKNVLNFFELGKRKNKLILNGKTYDVNCFNYSNDYPEQLLLNGDYFIDNDKLYRKVFTTADTSIFS